MVVRKINAVDSDAQSMTSELVSVNGSEKVQVIDDYSHDDIDRDFELGS